MPFALDRLGYCVIRPGRTDQLLLPLMWGSQFPNDRAFQIPGLASNVYGPVNAIQRIRTPVLFLRCRVWAAWFNVGTILQMFGRNLGNGQLIGTDGSGSLGPVQWKYAGEDPVAYAACKVASFTLLWNGAGAPLEAQITLAAYGARVNPNLGFRFGPYVNRPWHGTQMRHNALSQVWNGQLTIDNALAPNMARPNLRPSIDGDNYLVDYTNDSPSVLCDLEQATGAAHAIDSLFSDGMGSFLLTFNDPAYTSRVNFLLNVLAPSNVTTIRLSNGRVARRYLALKPSAPGDLIRVF